MTKLFDFNADNNDGDAVLHIDNVQAQIAIAKVVTKQIRGHFEAHNGVTEDPRAACGGCLGPLMRSVIVELMAAGTESGELNDENRKVLSSWLRRLAEEIDQMADRINPRPRNDNDWLSGLLSSIGDVEVIRL